MAQLASASSAATAAIEEEWASFGWAEVAHPKEVLNFDFSFSKLNAVLIAIGRALKRNNLTFDNLAAVVDGKPDKSEIDGIREKVVIIEKAVSDKADKSEVGALRERLEAQEQKLADAEKGHAEAMKALAERLAGVEQAQKDAQAQLAALQGHGAAAAAPAAPVNSTSGAPAASSVDGERLGRVERELGELRGGVAALASKKALEEETRALAAALDELRAQLAQLPAPKELERVRGVAEGAAPLADLRRSEEEAARKFAAKSDLARLQDAMAALAAAQAGRGPGEGAGASPAELAALMAASAGPGAAELAGRLEEGLASCAKLADLDALRAALAALQADAAGAERRIGELAAADERARADLDALHRALAALEARPAAEAPAPAAGAGAVGAGLWTGFPGVELEAIAGIEAALLEAGRELVRLQAAASSAEPAVSSSAGHPAPADPAGASGAGAGSGAWTAVRAGAARLLARLASIEGDIAACSAALQPLETAAAAVAVAAATTGDSHGAAALSAAGPQLAGSRLRHCGVHAAVLRAALEALQGSGVGSGVGGAGAASPEVAEALEKLRRRLRELEARLAELESAGPPLPAAAAGVSPEPETARVASPKASGGSGANAAAAIEAGRPASRGGAAALRLANALRGEVDDLGGRLEALQAGVRGLQAGQERAAARLDAEAEQRAAAIAALRAALEELRSRLTKAEADARATAAAAAQKGAAAAAGGVAPPAAAGGTVGLSDIHSRLDGLGARVAALEAAGPALHLHDAMPLTPHTPHAPALGPGATGAEELARAVARLEHAKADTAMFRKLAGETADLRASLDALRGQLASDFSSLAAKSEIDSLLRALEALRESVQGQLDRKPSHEELRELRDALARLQELFDRLQGEVREDSEARRRAIKEALDRLRRHLEDKIHKLHDNLTRTDDTDYTRVGRVHYRCLGCDRPTKKMIGVPVEHVVHDALPFRPPTVPALLYDHASGRPAIGPPPGATMGTGSGASPALALPGPTSQSMLATVSNSTSSLDASPIKAIRGASPILPAVVSPSRLPGPGFASPKGAS